MNSSKEKKYKYKFFKAVLDKDYNKIHVYFQKYLEYCNDSDIKNIFNKNTEMRGGSFNNDEKKYKYKFFKATLDKNYKKLPIYALKYAKHTSDQDVKNMFGGDINEVINKAIKLNEIENNIKEIEKNIKKIQKNIEEKNESYKLLINNIKEINDITKKFETDIQIELNTTPSIILNGVKKYLDIIEKKLTEYQNIPINPISIISSYFNILHQSAKNPDTEHNRKKMITMLQIIINNIKIINEILNTEQKNVSDLKTSVNQSIGEIYTIINSELNTIENEKTILNNSTNTELENEKTNLEQANNTLNAAKIELEKEKNKVIEEKLQLEKEKTELKETNNTLNDAKTKLTNEKNKVIEEKDKVIEEKEQVEKQHLENELKVEKELKAEKDKAIDEKKKTDAEKQQLKTEIAGIVAEKKKTDGEKQQLEKEKADIVAEKNKVIAEKEQLEKELITTKLPHNKKYNFLKELIDNKILYLESKNLQLISKINETKIEKERINIELKDALAKKNNIVHTTPSIVSTSTPVPVQQQIYANLDAKIYDNFRYYTNESERLRDKQYRNVIVYHESKRLRDKQYRNVLVY